MPFSQLGDFEYKKPFLGSAFFKVSVTPTELCASLVRLGYKQRRSLTLSCTHLAPVMPATGIVKLSFKAGGGEHFNINFSSICECGPS